MTIEHAKANAKRVSGAGGNKGAGFALNFEKGIVVGR